MLSFVADENFNHDIVRGLLRHMPDLDIVTVQEAGLSGCDDPDLLAWSAEQNRIVLTHDLATMISFACDRVNAGEKMPGVIEITKKVSIHTAIEELLLLAQCSFKDEWESQIVFIPLK